MYTKRWAMYHRRREPGFSLSLGFFATSIFNSIFYFLVIFISIFLSTIILFPVASKALCAGFVGGLTLIHCQNMKAQKTQGNTGLKKIMCIKLIHTSAGVCLLNFCHHF
jgi:hypothetical protein